MIGNISVKNYKEALNNERKKTDELHYSDRRINGEIKLGKKKIYWSWITRVRRGMIEENCELSLKIQCEILGISRSSIYYELKPKFSREDIQIMNKIDEVYTPTSILWISAAISRNKGKRIYHR